MNIEKRHYTPEEAQQLWEKVQYVKSIIYGLGIPGAGSPYWEDAEWLSKYLPKG